MRNKEGAPIVNAGSMAESAFLLLIFFLVTTSIETDIGIDSLLPSHEARPSIEYPDRNILLVDVNMKGEILVENDFLALEVLKQSVIEFLDNGGSNKNSLDYCAYCL
ncbi:MAG: biopolymer transporter ExbD [Flavobacteriaceae bacterium]